MVETKHARGPVRILLGGGIGSGKSTAGRMLGRLGATVLDADQVGHAVTTPGGEAFEAVISRWPTVLADGTIDRRRLAGIVFSDEGQLRELEAFTHPAIGAHIAAIASGCADLVVEIPLMLDPKGMWTRVFVDATAARRLSRAIERGSSEQGVRARMANQPTRTEWLDWADRVITNDGTLDDLERQVDELWREVTA